MNLSIGNKILLGFFISLVAMVAIGTVSYNNLQELNTDSAWVDHTLLVQQKVESMLASLLQAESASRGYQLAADDIFVTQFRNSITEVNQDSQALRILTADNPHQQDRLDKLEPLMAQRFDSLQRMFDLRKADLPNQDALRTQIVREGQGYMEQTQQIITDMVGEEGKLLDQRKAVEAETAGWTRAIILYGTLIAFGVVLVACLLITNSITRPLRLLGEGAARIGGGNYSHRVNIASQDEVGDLAALFNRMAIQVQERQSSLAEQDWLKGGLTKFATMFQGQRDLGLVCQSVLSELATMIEARHSLFYLPEGTGESVVLKLRAGYAIEAAPVSIKPGEGLVGQVYLEKKRVILDDLPVDYFKINSALGATPARTVLVLPAIFEGKVEAVIELATLRSFTPIQLSFLDQLAGSIGLVLHTIGISRRTDELLAQSQMLSADLQKRQAELTETNQKLEVQTTQLRDSESLLQEQQEELKQTNEEMEQTNEELQQTNEELEEKANLLAEQKKQMEQTNRQIELARQAVEEKAEQIAQTSKYKSEFLANMSHELRTPLNSLLILSKMLSDNNENNLTGKQIQYAQTIYSSGNDLLELINDILDLSKIESGAVEIEVSEMSFAALNLFIEQTFRHVADEKKLGFNTDLNPRLPQAIETDARRLQQILKNLISNAFKFTEKGSVRFAVDPVTEGWNRDNLILNQAPLVLALSVTDTGIGIPADKQSIIFEAFQQADAGTARKYGGTGLGLSISREIAGLLGGSLQVKSSPGTGSTFTLYLPAVLPANHAEQPVRPKQPSQKELPAPTPPASPLPSNETVDLPGVEDDRDKIEPGNLVLLIIEDDLTFASVLMDFARDKKFKAVVARTAAQGMALARQVRPSAITLDLHLPDNEGWIVLDRLKHDPETRHIPIHIISADEERERSLRLGAVSYFQKPVTKETLDDALTQTIAFINRPLKNLLIIEDDSVQRQSLVDLIGNGDVHSTAVGTAAEAFDALDKAPFDCIVLDLGLPDMNGTQLIREIHRKYGPHAPPVIVYTGKELSRQEETELRMISDSIVIKNVRSPERLLDETALFLHRVQTRLPEAKRRMIEQVQKNDSVLAGRKVLVVDDDVRNIFAITSALEASKMIVSYAESGQAGIDFLREHPDIEVILMDVMMPEMDGFEAIRQIRRIDAFRKLPIISVTAKAMTGDREKCLEAGASDYITKPVDMDQLRSLLRVWLYQ